MIGGGSTDKDKGPGKEMARVYNGRRGIIGRAKEREGWSDWESEGRKMERNRQQQSGALSDEHSRSCMI